MKDFRELLESNENSSPFIRMLKRITVGAYELSIQASTYHYSVPRKTLVNLFDYEAMEVAVFKNKDWINVEEDSLFDEWEEREQFLKDYDGMVARYIPIRMIQSLCDYIDENQKATGCMVNVASEKVIV
ncbi:hypothetical protein P5F14_15295 [Clostridium perfringens]|nr:hypothetical protein [Clostridium perfringens]